MYSSQVAGEWEFVLIRVKVWLEIFHTFRFYVLICLICFVKKLKTTAILGTENAKREPGVLNICEILIHVIFAIFYKEI